MKYSLVVLVSAASLSQALPFDIQSINLKGAQYFDNASPALMPKKSRCTPKQTVQMAVIPTPTPIPSSFAPSQQAPQFAQYQPQKGLEPQFAQIPTQAPILPEPTPTPQAAYAGQSKGPINIPLPAPALPSPQPAYPSGKGPVNIPLPAFQGGKTPAPAPALAQGLGNQGAKGPINIPLPAILPTTTTPAAQTPNPTAVPAYVAPSQSAPSQAAPQFATQPISVQQPQKDPLAPIPLPNSPANPLPAIQPAYGIGISKGGKL